MAHLSKNLTSDTSKHHGFKKLFFIPFARHLFFGKVNTGKLHRLDRCFLDWTNQCKSHLPLVAKPAFFQTATAASISGPIYETLFCSGSLKLGSFGYFKFVSLFSSPKLSPSKLAKTLICISCTYVYVCVKEATGQLRLP